jgi:hypothetical protein
MHSRTRDWIRWVAIVACACSAAGCQDKANEASSDAATSDDDHFSFFVASFQAMQALSGNEAGFGGDLRYGETGPGAGLRGADKICTEIAERSMPGSSRKRWRAFLSATAGEDGEQVNAIDRIGDGPWYDRLGRVFALTKADLLNDRPKGIDEAIAHDFPNEDGVPNQKPDPNQPSVDNHDILTGTNDKGQLYGSSATCLDWTSAVGDPKTEGRPRVGHSWDRMASDAVVEPPDGAMGGPMRGEGPRMMTGPTMFGIGGSGQHWMSTLDEAGCAAGVNLVQNGPPREDIPTVGSGGGYGGIYCFALAP